MEKWDFLETKSENKTLFFFWTSIFFFRFFEVEIRGFNFFSKSPPPSSFDNEIKSKKREK